MSLPPTADRASPPPEPRGGATDLESALREAAAQWAPAASPGRTYRLREAQWVLAAFAATVLMLDSEGLLTWAQRLEVGGPQSAALAVVQPLHAALDRAGLTAPRRALQRASAVLGRALGAAEDPLLVGGWADPGAAPPAPVDAAPEELALLDLALEPEPVAAPAPEAAPLPPQPEGVRTSVLLVGDSMIAGSLGTELSRQLSKNPRLEVVSAFQTATGLSRPDVYDWTRVLPQLLERERPLLVVASFGANDATNIRDQGRTLEFGEAGWRRAYAARVLAMMRTLAGERTRVLWLGLPPMRDARFSKKATYLNGIFAAAARRTPRVEFLEVDMLLSDGQGDFATYKRGADGRLARFRLDDGVHYSPAGARAISRWAVDWVAERLGALAPPRE